VTYNDRRIFNHLYWMQEGEFVVIKFSTS
jgi:hypothetical protein